tara:strand:+ start:1644 stop:1916 length:273 start_codon:yes stop_codon:yes gene_type:complete
MSLSRRLTLSNTSNDLKHTKQALDSEGTKDVTPPENASPIWRFRERCWKRLQQESHAVNINYWRNQALSKKMVMMEVAELEKKKARTGSY